mmetsp:Transcript_13534/g.27938  ORF Transcript_13534/g.27938 Transcript_13534/m.27938 type:complete len:231 (+) Transcript_13534:711-1403(+)
MSYCFSCCFNSRFLVCSSGRVRSLICTPPKKRLLLADPQVETDLVDEELGTEGTDGLEKSSRPLSSPTLPLRLFGTESPGDEDQFGDKLGAFSCGLSGSTTSIPPSTPSLIIPPCPVSNPPWDIPVALPAEPGSCRPAYNGEDKSSESLPANSKGMLILLSRLFGPDGTVRPGPVDISTPKPGLPAFLTTMLAIRGSPLRRRRHLVRAPRNSAWMRHAASARMARFHSRY